MCISEGVTFPLSQSETQEGSFLPFQHEKLLGVSGGRTHEIVVSPRSFILMILYTHPAASNQSYHLNIPSSKVTMSQISFSVFTTISPHLPCSLVSSLLPCNLGFLMSPRKFFSFLSLFFFFFGHRTGVMTSELFMSGLNLKFFFTFK